MPWLIQTAWGWAICQFDVAPPASDCARRAIMAVLRGWRRTNASDSSVISASMRVRRVDGHGGAHGLPFGQQSVVAVVERSVEEGIGQPTA